MDETTDMVKACLPARALLRPRVVRQVHAVPRGHELAREDPRAHPRRPRPPRGPRPAARRLRQHLAPASHWPPQQTTICPLGPSRRVADRLRDHALPRRVRGLHRRRRPRSPSPSTARRSSAPSRRSRGGGRVPDAQADDRDRAPSPSTARRSRPSRASWSSTPPSGNGIYIPRFCYHPRMKPVGMCRMCLVEIDTGRGPALQPALHDPGRAGHEGRHRVATVTKKAQDGVLEFLLINHPLDCPVCDKGGECPLQDQTIVVRPGREPLRRGEAALREADPDQRRLVYLDRERCILCDRCTRFAKEVAGDPLIHFQDRGNQTQVNTFPDHPFASYFSGNTVQICPVGALTAKPYRFKARPWDLDQVESTCTSCSVGCRRRAVEPPATRCSATRASTSTRSTGAGSATRAASTSSHRQPRTASAPRSSGRAGGELAEARWSDALGAAAAAIKAGLDRSGSRRGRRPRRRPPHQRGRLRLGQAGQGRHRHRPRRRPARRRPARPTSCSACPAPPSTRCAPRAARSLVLGPDLKEELPVLFLRLRHAVTKRRAPRSSSWPRTDTGARPRSPPPRCATARRSGRPSWRALLAGRRTGAGGRRRRRPRLGTRPARPRRPGHRRARPAIGRRVRRRRRRRGRRACSPASPAPASCRRCAAATSTAPSTWAWPPACCPAASRSTTAGDWFGAALAHASPPSGASTPPASSPRPPTASIDALVLLGADPLADFPDRDLAARGLAGARTVIAVDLFLTESAAAGRRRAAGRRLRRGRRHHHQPRGPGHHARPEGHAARHRPRRLDDRRRARRPPRRRPRLRVGRRHLGRDRAPVARATPGITVELLSAPGAADGVIVPLPACASPHARRRHVTAGTRRGPGAGDAAEPDGRRDRRGRRRRRGPGRARPPRASQAADSDEATAAAGRGRRCERRRRSDADAAEADADRRPPTPTRPPRPRRPAAVLTFTGSTARSRRPPVDAYSLRLVTVRKLYDQGTLVQHSPLARRPGRARRRCAANPVRPRPPRRRRRRSGPGHVQPVQHHHHGHPRRRRCPGAPAALASEPGRSVADRRSSTPTQPVTDVRVETTS